jgi:hypothetical protein
MSGTTRQDEPAFDRGRTVPPTVFISYASNDAAVAEQICRLLEDDAIGCWIAPRNVDPGHDFAEQILDGIESTRVMVLLLSAHANASPFVKREVERAISKGKVVIPFRIEEVRPSRSLELYVSTNQWIDAWTPPLESRVHVLASAIRGLLKLPPLQGDGAATGTGYGVPPWPKPGFRRRFFGVPSIAGLAAAAALLVVTLLAGLVLTSRGSVATFGPSASTTISSPSASATGPVSSRVGPSSTPFGAFKVVGSMSAGRGSPTVVPLHNNKILVLGGSNKDGAVTTAELYDPSTEKFAPTGSMSVKRTQPTATLLDDGTVLVAGGRDAELMLSSAEIYDPDHGTFSLTGEMATPHEGGSATKLTDGRVLVAGGNLGTSLDSVTASAETYDPATRRFTVTGSMTTARAGQSAALVDGRVLIAGGANGAAELSSAELYDPKNGTFTKTGSLHDARGGASAVLLSGGRVLVAGGEGGSDYVLSSAELYDPTSGSFSLTGSLSVARSGMAVAILQDGRVLFAGGQDAAGTVLASTEAFDPASGSFATSRPMRVARCWAGAAPVKEGAIVVGGMNADGDLASAEWWGP